MRALKALPLARCCASGPTKGTVEGSASMSGVRGGSMKYLFGLGQFNGWQFPAGLSSPAILLRRQGPGKNT
jgi:hypothetical protein